MSAALAVVLLCALSWASVCDLSCQLPALAGHGCCAGKANAVPAPVAVAGSSDCHGMAGMTSHSVEAELHAPLQAGTMPCERNIAVASSESVDHSHNRVGLVAMLIEPLVAGFHQPATIGRRESPPQGTAGFRPLLVSLRV